MNEEKHERRVHVCVNGVLTVNAVVTLALHEVNHFAEAVAFMVGGVMAVWANDFERTLHRRRLKRLLDKLEEQDRETDRPHGFYHDMANYR